MLTLTQPGLRQQQQGRAHVTLFSISTKQTASPQSNENASFTVHTAAEQRCLYTPVPAGFSVQARPGSSLMPLNRGPHRVQANAKKATTFTSEQTHPQAVVSGTTSPLWTQGNCPQPTLTSPV